jgi:hypothetical protein
LSKSIWADSLKRSDNFLIKMLHDAEFAYRYETFGNLLVEDAVYWVDVNPNPDPWAVFYSATRTDVFKSSVHTIGLNYYWKGYNIRTQINYSFVKESDGHHVSTNYSLAPHGKRIREVRNNVFVISQQVQW